MLLIAGGSALATVDDLFAKVRLDDVGQVRQMLDAGYDVDSVDAQGDSLLLAAAREGAGGVTRLLIARRARIDYRNTHHETALMFAALRGHLEIVRQLISAGAKVNQPGWCALHYAAFDGHTSVVRLLLDRGADIDALTPNGSSALMLAAREGHFEALKLLLWEVAEPNIRNEAGLTALGMAVKSGNPDIIRLLQQAGAHQ